MTTFSVSSSKLLVGDPCYGTDLQLQAHIRNVLSGTWTARRLLRRIDDQGSLCSELHALHESVTEPAGLIWKPKRQWICVDSGMAGVFCGRTYPKEAHDEFYDSLCDAMDEGVSTASGPFWVLTQAGKGDGQYRVLTALNCAKRVVAVKIVFLP